MSLSVVVLLVWVRIVKPFMVLRRPWRVERVVPRAGDASSLVLRADGHEGIRFQPGQFAWITVGRSPLRITEHPFSFSSSAEDPHRIEFTIKALGDFTSTVADIEPGTAIYLDGPYGVFTYERNEASGFVFVAGGIGITPVLSMVRTLADRGDRRPLWLVYANDEWSEVAFRDELDELRQRCDLRLVHVLAAPPPGWDGEQGFVDEELLARHLPEEGRDRLEYFLCGPEPMMDAAADALRDLGVHRDRIHSERFSFI
jgi:predicted ferric reductase